MKEKLDKIEFILEHLREPERLLEEGIRKLVAGRRE